MTRLFDLSSSDELLPPLEVLRSLHERAKKQSSQWVVIGAAARDLTIHAPLGISPHRATKDIDIAVAIPEGSTFNAFTDGLIPVRGILHRFWVENVQVDIVPFGAVERNGHVTFDDDRVLNVIGLAEAAAAPDLAVIPGHWEIPVASLEAQSILKIIAWNDRRHDSTKDALDLFTILSSGSEGCYADETWGDDEALEACEHDIWLAGAFRVGRRAAGLFNHDRAPAVTGVLRNPDRVDQLTRNMQHRHAGMLLDSFTRGFEVGQRKLG
ncbi:hypothetical protein AADG42_17780 [Ammonicoccus fulvus]|uniref:Nucleotidyltransferase n=1 Tax=Ammonicoccus fulvus TaxID=3138240 RepID=A0ABZ3FSM0_9ACTN